MNKKTDIKKKHRIFRQNSKWRKNDRRGEFFTFVEGIFVQYSILIHCYLGNKYAHILTPISKTLIKK